MKPLAKSLALTAALALCALPGPAKAWGGRVGVFIGLPPVVIGGPLYYPAPVYAPPPPYYPPPPAAPYAPPPPRQIGFTCYARPYQCPLERPRKVGKPCACLDLGGAPVPGTVVQ